MVRVKEGRLSEPHIAPLIAFADEIEAATGHKVPRFDPDTGGVHSRLLFLLENPGPRSSREKGSGFISIDNDDGTAETFFKIVRDVGLRRDQFLNWNVVPWYQPDGNRTANATRADVDEARPWLERLIALLPDLRLVIPMGVRARDGWMRLLATDPSIPLLPTIAIPHCSPRNLAGRPTDRDLIMSAVRRAAALVNA